MQATSMLALGRTDGASIELPSPLERPEKAMVRGPSATRFRGLGGNAVWLLGVRHRSQDARSGMAVNRLVLICHPEARSPIEPHACGR